MASPPACCARLSAATQRIATRAGRDRARAISRRGDGVHRCRPFCARSRGCRRARVGYSQPGALGRCARRRPSRAGASGAGARAPNGRPFSSCGKPAVGACVGARGSSIVCARTVAARPSWPDRTLVLDELESWDAASEPPSRGVLLWVNDAIHVPARHWLSGHLAVRVGEIDRAREHVDALEKLDAAGDFPGVAMPYARGVRAAIAWTRGEPSEAMLYARRRAATRPLASRTPLTAPLGDARAADARGNPAAARSSRRSDRVVSRAHREIGLRPHSPCADPRGPRGNSSGTERPRTSPRSRRGNRAPLGGVRR